MVHGSGRTRRPLGQSLIRPWVEGREYSNIRPPSLTCVPLFILFPVDTGLYSPRLPFSYTGPYGDPLPSVNLSRRVLKGDVSTMSTVDLLLNPVVDIVILCKRGRGSGGFSLSPLLPLFRFSSHRVEHRHADSTTLQTPD